MRGHICEKGRSWCVVIYLGRDPHTKKKKQRWFTFPTKREAEARLAQLLLQVQSGGIPQSRIRLSEFLDRWMQDCVADHVRETTKKIYEYAVKNHIVPHLGFIPLAQLSPPAIQEWVSQLHKQELSVSTAHQAFRVLRTALHQAVAWNIIPKSPTDSVKAPRLAEREFKVWDEEQIRLFLAEARRSSPFYGLDVTAILTGMRLGELLGLR